MTDLYLSEDVHALHAARIATDADPVAALEALALEAEQKRLVAEAAAWRKRTRLERADAALGDWRARIDAGLKRAS